MIVRVPVQNWHNMIHDLEAFGIIDDYELRGGEFMDVATLLLEAELTFHPGLNAEFKPFVNKYDVRIL